MSEFFGPEHFIVPSEQVADVMSMAESFLPQPPDAETSNLNLFKRSSYEWRDGAALKWLYFNPVPGAYGLQLLRFARSAVSSNDTDVTFHSLDARTGMFTTFRGTEDMAETYRQADKTDVHSMVEMIQLSHALGEDVASSDDWAEFIGSLQTAHELFERSKGFKVRFKRMFRQLLA